MNYKLENIEIKEIKEIKGDIETLKKENKRIKEKIKIYKKLIKNNKNIILRNNNINKLYKIKNKALNIEYIYFDTIEAINANIDTLRYQVRDGN